MALSLLTTLIEKIEQTNEQKQTVVIDEDDASNTLGGDITYFFGKFDAQTEQNTLLKAALQQKEDNLSPEKSKQLNTQYIFAYFLRHYSDKAKFIVDNRTDLKQFIKQEILTTNTTNKINAKAQQLLSNIQKASASKGSNDRYHPKCYEWELDDAFLVELGHWFNNDFFTWYKPKCVDNNCCDKNSKMEYIDMVQDNDMKQQFEDTVSRVHIYQCSKCKKYEYFERFYVCEPLIKNNKYRRGFCGDHCEAFAAIVDALDYKWRFALDDTDHIWLEIYSNHREKWCCFEPSPESNCKRYDYNKFSTRESRYIFAIDGANPFEDVTEIYQTDQKVLQKRRENHCISQEWIKSFVSQESEIRFST
eukprot:197150_1